MRALELADFAVRFLDNTAHYYAYDEEEIEICLEPCMGGYCVGLYKKSPLFGDIPELAYPKRCTNYADHVANDIVLGLALQYANDFYKTYKKGIKN